MENKIKEQREEKERLPKWTRKSKRRRTLMEIWDMNSRFSQSAWTAIPTFTALVIPPALAIALCVCVSPVPLQRFYLSRGLEYADPENRAANAWIQGELSISIAYASRGELIKLEEWTGAATIFTKQWYTQKSLP